MTRCTRCQAETPPRREWAALDPDQRAAWRAAGKRRHAGRGLCTSCYARARRTGELPDHERRHWRAADLWEEWQHLADPLAHVTAEAERLAPQLGVSPQRLHAVAKAHGWRSRFVGGWGERVREGWAA